MTASTRPSRCRLLLLALMSAWLASGCTEKTWAASAMPESLSPGAQAPDAPHPGTLVVKYVEFGITKKQEIMSTGEMLDALRRIEQFRGLEERHSFVKHHLPESFLLSCVDANGNPAERRLAAWCVPVAEIAVETPGLVPLKEADRLLIRLYGPDHQPLGVAYLGPPIPHSPPAPGF